MDRRRKKRVPCPKCIKERKINLLSEPYFNETYKTVAIKCPIHGEFYDYQAFRVVEGKVIDLLTEKRLKINK